MADKLTETVELEPCPFCRGEFPPCTAIDDSGHVVICVSCSALGPTRPTEAAAIAAWNTRAALSRPNVDEMREALELAASRLDAAAERSAADADISAVVGYRQWAQEARAALRGSADNG